ncbi:MAG: glycosyltransferase family 2 protein [Candidatus Humimicrobiaceae bacterium]
MGDTSLPFVSIITVNFNGIFFLKTLFDSIASLNYPQEKLQVIMVDNGSTDGSVSYVKYNYPFVEILEINKNLGFAGGNNAGAKAAKGDYIAFINNDCVVEKDWLLSLINTLKEKEEEHIKIGGAGSKVLFYFKYLPLKVSISSVSQKNSHNEDKDEYSALVKGLKIKSDNKGFVKSDLAGSDTYKKNLYKFANKSFKYLTGFYDFGRDSDKNIIRKIKNDAVVWVPVADMSKDMELEMMVSFTKPDMNLKISLENENIFNFEESPGFFLFDKDAGNAEHDIKSVSTISYGDIEGIKTDAGGNIKSMEANKSHAGIRAANGENLTKSPDELNFIKVIIKIPSEKYKHSRSIINSCGSMINKAFYAREINYECIDDTSCEKPFEVFALPGSSFIINKKLAEKTGLFDEKFFTYYEDIDLFWRSALKGWKFFAVPQSVSRHFHCGSGEEWSYGFTYHVLRNRLLMIYRCCWFTGFMKNYLSFCAAAFINLLYLAAAKIRGRDLFRPDIPIRIKIFFEFFILMALHLGKRFKIRTVAKITDKTIQKWQQNF